MLILRRIGIFLILIFFWQAMVWIFKLPPYILPSPLQVAESFLIHGTLLFHNTLPTITETILGLSLGIAWGMSLALLMASIEVVRYWLLPLIVISQAIPTFAIAPVLVNWFGYGLLSKVITIMLMLFFPVASSLYEGLARIPGNWLDMAKIMNGRKSIILWRLRFPAALSHLAAGVRVATALAPLGAIISEWVGASHGLGFLMLNANGQLQIDLMFACIIIVMALSIFLYLLVDKILKAIITW